MLMNRVKKINKRALALPVLVIGVIIGIGLICFGAMTIHGYYEELGTKSSEEINSELETKSEEYRLSMLEANEEFEKNGTSDKYIELNKKNVELDKEITSLTNSRYMKETGYHNPNSVGKILELAPTIWIGALVVIASAVAFVVLKQ